MPELPEVETVRAGLEKHVLGRTVATAAVLNPRAVRRDPTGPAGFTAAMIGRTFTGAERRGKYMWFALDDGEALLAHLGMSGQLLVGPPDRELSSHVRAAQFRGDSRPVGKVRPGRDTRFRATAARLGRRRRCLSCPRSRPFGRASNATCSAGPSPPPRS